MRFAYALKITTIDESLIRKLFASHHLRMYCIDAITLSVVGTPKSPGPSEVFMILHPKIPWSKFLPLPEWNIKMDTTLFEH